MAHLRPWLCVATSSLTLALAACTGTVSGVAGPGDLGPEIGTSVGSGGESPGTGGQGGGGAGPGTGGAASSPLPSVPGVIALTAEQLGMSSCGSSAPCDPATLFLLLGVPSPTCTDPQPEVMCGPTSVYEVSIGIPPGMLQPGTLMLSDPGLYVFFRLDGPSQGGPEGCTFGGGSFPVGVIALDSVDDASVTFTLSGTMSFPTILPAPGSVDGTYVATRCP
jgi:hypothetical protein